MAGQGPQLNQAGLLFLADLYFNQKGSQWIGHVHRLGKCYILSIVRDQENKRQPKFVPSFARRNQGQPKLWFGGTMKRK